MKYKLFDNGKLIGESEVVTIDRAKVITSIAPIISKMKEHAKKDGVDLIVASGLRTWEEQIELRKKNLIDKSRINDVAYLTLADSSAFRPVTGKPGFSNHQDGSAFDFEVTGKPKVYVWLVKNAFSYGFVRTVPSERWHWEYMPNIKNPYFIVPKKHETWDKLEVGK